MLTRSAYLADAPSQELLRRARALLERGDRAAALEAAEAILREQPDCREALYLVAVSTRYLGRLEEALDTLAHLETLQPQYGRLFQERGHCYRALARPTSAIEAYERAVALNAALPSSWAALAELYRASGRVAESERAARHAAHIASLPRPLVSASSLVAEGDLRGAERLCRGFLQTQGHHLEGMRLLAEIGVKLNVLDDAEFLLESVVELAPEHQAARYEYALVLAKRQKHANALKQAQTLCASDLGNRAYRTLHATECAAVGYHEMAVDLYKGLLEETPRDPELHLSVGHALKTLGRQPEAVAAYRRAAARRPSYGDAYWSLANLKTYRFSDEELERMSGAEADGALTTVDRYHLCFALGKGLEDRGLYAQSFQYYARGNALKREELKYEPQRMHRDLRLQSTVCTSELFEELSGSGCERADPIFIVGLPRAGSTLLEQVLASHSRVDGTMELHNIVAIAHELLGRSRVDEKPAYPAGLGKLGGDRLRRLGERYMEETRVHRKGAPFFIDKMPNNFRHIGLIHLILPKARIIDASRGAMACCFSGFKQLFAAGQDFSYGLEDIGRYYHDYVDLMAHWDRVLPGKVLGVRYEDVVWDLEGSVRRIFDFLKLDFEPQCLEFYNNRRSVRTASSEQVRQPLYREGLDRWRHYEPWLDPLKAALGSLAAAHTACLAEHQNA
jgi:tetratricopeptide (TPR) repeat protein